MKSREILYVFVLLVASIGFSSCEKHHCRECYTLRSQFAQYLDTVLPSYMIPADTVKTSTTCGTKEELEENDFSREKYDYISQSIYNPKLRVKVTVTETTYCPESNTDTIQ